MAKSGYCGVVCNSQNMTSNISNITVYGDIVTSGESYRGNTRTGSYTVYKDNIPIYSESFTHGAPANSTTRLFTVTLDIGHDATGYAGTISASYNYDNGWCTGSGYAYIPSILRNAEVISATDFTDEGNPSITFTPAGTGTLSVWLELNSVGDHLAIRENIPNTGSYTWSLTDAERNQLREACSTKNSCTCRIGIYTHINGVSYARYADKTFTIVNPSPTIDDIKVSDAGGYKNIYGKFVQSKSSLNVEIIASGKYGSTITEYKTNFDGKIYTDREFTTSPISGINRLPIEVTIRDSRGNYVTETKEIDVFSYEQPKILSASTQRCNADGTLNSSGEYLKLSFDSSITSLNNINGARYTIQYKKQNESDYTPSTPIEIVDYTGEYEIHGGSYIFHADKSSSYNILLCAIDDFATISKTIHGSSVKKIFSIFGRGLGVAFGKVAELANTLEVALRSVFSEEAVFNGAVYGQVKGLGWLPKIPSESNFDTYTDIGIYSVVDDETSETITSIPIQKCGVLETYESDGGNETDMNIYRTQKYIPNDATKGTFYRSITSSDNGEAWTFGDWHQECYRVLASSANIDPNSGWVWTKYSNGMAKCYIIFTGDSAYINNPWNGLYYSNAYIMPNYPIDFIGYPISNIEYIEADSAYSFSAMTIRTPGSRNNINSEKCAGVIELVRADSLTIGHPRFSIYAEGRWK